MSCKEWIIILNIFRPSIAYQTPPGSKNVFFEQMLNPIMCIRYVSGGNPWAIFIVKRLKEISRASGNTEYTMNAHFGLQVLLNLQNFRGKKVAA